MRGCSKRLFAVSIQKGNSDRQRGLVATKTRIKHISAWECLPCQLQKLKVKKKKKTNQFSFYHERFGKAKCSEKLTKYNATGHYEF